MVWFWPASDLLSVINQFIQNFHNDHPDVNFTIMQCNLPKAYRSLDEEVCDFSITIFENNLPSNLNVLPFHKSDIVFCVGKNSPLVQKEYIDYEDLKDFPLILSQENAYISKLLKTEFYKQNIVPNIIMYSVQLNLIHEMVLDNRCGAFILREIAEKWSDVGIVPLKNKIPITFSLIWRKDRYLSKKGKKMIDFISTHKNNIQESET